MDFVISREEMLEGMEKMNSCGVRLTGSPAHNEFIAYLKAEISKMGVEIFSDPFWFDVGRKKAPPSTSLNPRKR